MTELIQAVVKLGVAAYLLYGTYHLIIGILERNRKKIRLAVCILVLPAIALIVILVLLSRKYGN
ncbi:MAG: hypothetical protein MJ071_04710 [Oscillospiraceae bacterium]|nr:hypothetical protein [Oscillospiraceae bacterium]